MQFKPILFSTSMVQAILQGRKTQTRRVCKKQFIDCSELHKQYVEADWCNEPMTFSENGLKHGLAYCGLCGNSSDFSNDFNGLKCPYGKPGDVLWVRETWTKVSSYPEPDCFGKYLYKSMCDKADKWKPSIFMPKEACRIFLQIKSVRVERLQGISEQDAISEGIEQVTEKNNEHDLMIYRSYHAKPSEQILPLFPYVSFRTLWQSINGFESWGANPWLWVIEFERIEKPENFK